MKKKQSFILKKIAMEKIPYNEIRNEDCLDTMANMPNNYVDLTITSPPYDNLRKYNGYSFDFEAIAKELYRVTENGGVVVWVVGDATIKAAFWSRFWERNRRYAAASSPWCHVSP